MLVLELNILHVLESGLAYAQPKGVLGSPCKFPCAPGIEIGSRLDLSKLCRITSNDLNEFMVVNPSLSLHIHVRLG